LSRVRNTVTIIDDLLFGTGDDSPARQVDACDRSVYKSNA